MSGIFGQRKIGSISIPGTHVSGADNEGIPLLPGLLGLVKTQHMDISGQLVAGIRYFDIRCGEIGSGTKSYNIFHGNINLLKSFYNVLDDMTNYLKIYPRETILMRVKLNENDPDSPLNLSGRISLFNHYVSVYREFFWEYNGNDDPTLDQVRRKIVIIQDFDDNGKQYGIKWSSFDVQDKYDTSGFQEKNDVIFRFFNVAQKGDRKIINHLSAVTMTSAAQIKLSTYAATMNPFMTGLIKSYQPNYVGIVPADFPEYELILAIIRTNPEYQVYQSL